MGYLRRQRKKDPRLIEIEGKLVSGEVTHELFACDLKACKGACCVEGDLGAPLEKEELVIMDEVYPKVKPYMRRQGIQAVQAQGTSVRDFTGGFSTPLVEGKECAYVQFDEQGTALCAIEQAHMDGEIDFKKPISCELYPIRVERLSNGYELLNYDRWSICAAACSLGEQLGIPVYEFVKNALIRSYGAAFYEALDEAVRQIDEAEEMSS